MCFQYEFPEGKPPIDAFFGGCQQPFTDLGPVDTPVSRFSFQNEVLSEQMQ